MAYLKKFLFGTNWPFRTQILTFCLPTLDSLKGLFCIMKGAKGDMEIILMVFLKEILFIAIWSFWNKNGLASS